MKTNNPHGETVIKEYYRPQTLDDALSLLSQPDTLPLGGGTLLSRPGPAPVKVVDLQALGLNTLTSKGNSLEIGATVSLQQLLESPETSTALKAAIKLEAPLNVRNSATVAGTLVAADGRSTFTTLLLALDAKLGLQPNDEESEIGNFLPLRSDNLHNKLITTISIPANLKLAFEYVSRTPADKPIVCAALAQWPSGRTRLALGGYGKAPLLAMDGTEADGIEAAARNAFHEASDEWASAEYRMDVAATLAKRCIALL
jgi:CO/xanthine dehydrogenase FAD-binding subunit